jgi:hypothetical protein
MPIQDFIQWVIGNLSPESRIVDLHLQSPIRLHGVVLDQFKRTGNIILLGWYETKSCYSLIANNASYVRLNVISHTQDMR